NALVDRVMRNRRAMRDGDEPPCLDSATPIGLPNNSHDFATETAKASKAFLKEAEALRSPALDSTDSETLDILIWDLECDVGLAPFYWHDFPIGYRNSQVAQLRNMLGTAPAAADTGAYLAQLRQAPSFVENVRLKLLGGHARGLTPPRT